MPVPKPSRARFRFQSAPDLREWPPMIQEKLSATENEFWITVRSTPRPASTMFVGRLEPEVNWKDGKPSRVWGMLGGSSSPSWVATAALLNVDWRAVLS